MLRIINLHDKKVFRSGLLINESMTTLLFNALNNIKIIHYNNNNAGTKMYFIAEEHGVKGVNDGYKTLDSGVMTTIFNKCTRGCYIDMFLVCVVGLILELIKSRMIIAVNNLSLIVFTILFDYS